MSKPCFPKESASDIASCSLSTRLLSFLPGRHERVGLVLDSGEIIELRNVASDPTSAFEVAAVDMIKHESRAVATWHTHPNGGSSPSGDDMEGFLMWPALLHYIVSEDGVQCYRVSKGAVLNHAG